MKTLFPITLSILYFSLPLYGNPVPVAIQHATNSVAKIKTPNGPATGFFINQDTLVTSAHSVINGDKLIPYEELKITQVSQQKNADIQVERYKALSLTHDLALIKVKNHFGSVLTPGHLIPGEEVYSVSFLQEKPHLLRGHNVTTQRMDYHFFINSSNLRGGSGSPILNSKGQVVGILYTAAGNSMYAKQSSALTRLLNNMKTPNTALLHDEIARIHRLANTGDPYAQYTLGNIYYGGKRGRKQDFQEARKWLQLAAENGVAEAQHNLGWMYSKGLGGKQNFQEARKWLQLAAENGLAEAQFAMGNMYFKGLGVKRQNLKETLRWYKESATQGYAEAQFNLGWMYAEGIGVKPDLHESTKWLAKAAEQGVSTRNKTPIVKQTMVKKMISKMINPFTQLCRKIF